MKVLQFPLARITPWFITGIACASFLEVRPISVFLFVALAAILWMASWGLARRDLIQRPYFAVCSFVLAFALGAGVSAARDISLQPDHFSHQITAGAQTVDMVLRERLKNTPRNQRYVAHVYQLDNRPATGKLLVQFDRLAFERPLPIGTVLKVHAPLAVHHLPKNPNQFDYGAYLRQRLILAQMYITLQPVKIRPGAVKDVFYYADRVRHTILTRLEQSGCAPQELAVIAALLLGQQQDIGADTVRDYQLAGAVHILSVSGLHVGLILAFLHAALGLLPNTPRMRGFKLGIILFSLWGFALLAGLSPSVVRSVTMFSFMAIGLHLRRKTNIFHTLLVSMLLILTVEPSFLSDIGFQLSYLALFFILWLQPMMDRWWEPRNKIARYLWQIVTVSFAAQIGTLPLSIYYFHQFPGLFFVTNLVVIPLLSVVMALGVAAMIIALFTALPLFLATALSTSVTMLNGFISWIASFEEFVFTELSLNRAMMIGLYVLLIALVRWLSKPDFAKTITLLASLLVLQCTWFATRWDIATKKEWIVFSVYKSTGIAARDGHTITAYGPPEFLTGPPLQTYATAHFAQIRRGGAVGNVAYFNRSRIVIIDSTGVCPKLAHPDVILIRQSPRINLERLIQTITPGIIVADASNYKSDVALWKSTCAKYKIPFHTTAEMGFYKR